jgi:hypothetical protein
VRLIKLDTGDRIGDVAKIVKDEGEEVELGEAEGNGGEG